MVQMNLQLTRSSRLWDTSTPLRKKRHFNRLYGDTQKRDFRPLEDKKNFFLYRI
jgi:hypothetical protein